MEDAACSTTNPTYCSIHRPAHLLSLDLQRLTLSFATVLKSVYSSALEATLSRRWKQNLEPRSPYVEKDPSRKEKADLTQLTPVIRKKIFIA